MDQTGFPPAESSPSPAIQPAPLLRMQAWVTLASARRALTTVPTQSERAAA